MGVFCSVVGFVITLQSFSAFENLTLQVFFWGVLAIARRGRALGVRRRNYAVVVKLDTEMGSDVLRVASPALARGRVAPRSSRA